MLHMAVDIEQRKSIVIVSCVQLLSNFHILPAKPTGGGGGGGGGKHMKFIESYGSNSHIGFVPYH